MPEPYKKVVAEIKSVNEKLKELNHKKKSAWTEDETAEHQALQDKRKELRIKKHDELLIILSSLAENVNSNSFKFDLSIQKYRDKEEFVIDKDNRAAYYAMCQLQHNMKRTFNIEMESRHSIMVSIKRLLNTKTPLYAIRTDVSGFFESIPQDPLLAKIESNSLLSYKSKSFIRAILKEYNEKKDTSAVDAKHGVPRGVGISSMLSEIYMQGIDRELKNRQEVIFYVRYVDDIFMLLASIGSHGSIEDYYKDLRTFFIGKGLSLKDVGDDKCKLLDYVNESQPNDSFYYLGYDIELTYKASDKGLSAEFSLSKKKRDKLRNRIQNAFLHFENLSKVDLKQARRDMLDALRLISGNIRLRNSKNGIKAGLYYSNDLLDEIGLKELDKFTQRIHHMSLNVPEETISDDKERREFVNKLRKRIEKTDLLQSWKNRTVYNIHMDRLSEIMKGLDYGKEEN
ncbi:MAG: RNA-directed DNA polymerase [Prevotella sp.]|nr:RNA-directed DNA polymerase [Prevotella sp.]